MFRGKLCTAGVTAAVAALILAGFGTPASADDGTPPANVAVDPSASSGHEPSRPLPLASTDDLVAAGLARAHIDWFAGLYRDGRSTVVQSTRPGVGGREVSKAVQVLVEAGALSSKDDVRSVQVKVVKYPFGALNGWKKSLEPGFFPLVGAVLTDVDEKVDRVVLGYDPTKLTKNKVQAVVQRAGVPPDAVDLRPTAPVVPDGLQDRSANIFGGLQITSENFETCSVGFVAIRNGVHGFVTASHCTRTMGQVNGDRFYQPTPIVSWLAGRELVDFTLMDPRCEIPANFSGCRFSDAAFIEDVAGSSNFLGYAPVISAQGDPAAWDGGIAPTRTEGVSVQGQPVFKLGRTTGKTVGVIDETCANVAAPLSTNVILRCQDHATYPAGVGDSGGPVLGSADVDLPNGPFTLYGTHWSHTASGGFFSRISFINAELGPMTFLAP